MNPRTTAGAALLALGLGFNLPYAWLAANFDYPGVLRQPAAVVLARVVAGGPELVLAWHGFMLAALALTVTAALVAVAERQRPSATIVGVLGVTAGVLQAIGLSRWVFVVPALAAAQADLATTAAGRAAIEASFLTLHQFAGVAIGEHLGQWFTALWVIGVANGQQPTLRRFGITAALLILTGTGEGLAMALGRDSEALSLATIAGFLLLTFWLIGAGIALLRRPPVARQG